MQKKKPCISQNFGNICSFIDDLTTINVGGEFENALHKIYLPELESKKQKKSPSAASVSDLGLKFSDKKFTLGFYDKCDSFPLSIVRMQYLSIMSLLN